jgi:hypothetical protein
MLDAYRTIVKTTVGLCMLVAVNAAPVRADVVQPSLTDKGYFSGRGAYSGAPVEVVGADLTPVVDRVMTNAAVIPSDREAIDYRPIMPVQQAIRMHRSVSPLLHFRLF